MKRLLYFGSSAIGSTSLQRFHSLSKIYPNAMILDSRLFFPDRSQGRSLSLSVQIRLGLGSIYSIIEERLLEQVNKFHPDIVWIDAGYLVTSKTINSIRGFGRISIVHYTPDSMKAPGMGSNSHRKSLHLYDLVVTTKSQDLPIYRACKVKNILFTLQGYDNLIHKKIKIHPSDIKKYSCDVSFVGNYSKDRLALLISLSSRINGKLHIYGDRWGEFSKKFSTNTKIFGNASGTEYAKAVCAAKINLGLLNHKVKDEYTTRSFEIPAIGGFMLAENTKAHRDIFEECNGAALFENFDDLCNKINYYLGHDTERINIAINGHKQIIKLDVSWDSLIREICKKIP